MATANDFPLDPINGSLAELKKMALLSSINMMKLMVLGKL